jgi:hypothetical protein
MIGNAIRTMPAVSSSVTTTLEDESHHWRCSTRRHDARVC